MRSTSNLLVARLSLLLLLLVWILGPRTSEGYLSSSCSSSPDHQQYQTLSLSQSQPRTTTSRLSQTRHCYAQSRRLQLVRCDGGEEKKDTEVSTSSSSSSTSFSHLFGQATRRATSTTTRRRLERPRAGSVALSATTVSSSSGDGRSSSTSINGLSSEEDDPEVVVGAVGATSTTTVSRLRRLKDLMWVREAREDLTAAEFACSVEAAAASQMGDDSSTSTDTAPRPRKRKRAVDYEKLMSQLNKRIRDMGCDNRIDKDTTTITTTATTTDVSCVLQPGVGMGSIVYTDKQREALLERILRTRQMLLEVMKGHELFSEDELPFTIALPELRVEIPKEKDDPSAPGPKLYVRDDGTVDWDGALQDREALRKFGTAVWARINGRDPESIDGTDDDEGQAVQEMATSAATTTATAPHKTEPKVVTAKVEETPEIQRARSKLNELQSQLATMEKEHVALLSSAISAGQAVANVNLASLQPQQRIRIIESAEAVEKMKEQVSFQTMIYELERIDSYLVKEVGNPTLTGYIPLQDRLNVAEFGLLESQIENFNQLLQEGDLVDADVLAVVMDQLIDFKRRLGIDYSVTGVTFDGDGLRRWFADLLEQTKKGLAFYVKGVQLFWNDIVFCLSLINRAAQGYTLKPREVRTLRRTFKDIITFIPVVIILLIPLSPVGHVLVFGAIQRFFPDFFPSCFTEQRQNLLQLYETAEYSEFSIQENWKEKLARLSEAFVYYLVNTSRAIYIKLGAIRSPKEDDIGNAKKKM